MMKIPEIHSEQSFIKNVLPNIDNYKNTFFISIFQPDEKKRLREDSENYKTLEIWDIPYTVGTYEAFDYKDAQNVYKYLKQHEGKHLIIHCALGISRSASIAEFYFEMQGGSYRELIQKYPNILPAGLTPILGMLRMAEKENGEDVKIKFV